MADALSQASLDSATDEFVVVNAEPRLRIADNGDVRDLESKMSEVLSDDKKSPERPEKVNPFNKKKGTEDVATVGVDDDVNADSGLFSIGIL